MDVTVIRNKMAAWGRKYKYVIVVLGLGIFLMLLPGGTENDKDIPVVEPQRDSICLEMTEEQLEAVLSKIDGAGEVDVLLTYASGERTVFHADERSASDENGQTRDYETVIITGSDRIEEALVAQVVAPEYLGAVIVCQGAENPSVRLAVSDAVSKATGLRTDRISVLKMK